MLLSENRQLLSLLVKAYNTSIQDFYYFPDVILVGEQRMERDDFDLLRSGGYILEFRHDSFGRFYRLSQKAEHLLYQLIVSRSPARKKRMPKQKPEFCLMLPGM